MVCFLIGVFVGLSDRAHQLVATGEQPDLQAAWTSIIVGIVAVLMVPLIVVAFVYDKVRGR